MAVKYPGESFGQARDESIMWQSLLANFAVTAAVLVGWNALGEWAARLSPLRWRLLFGTVMGAAAVSGMVTAFQPLSGVFYDLRGPLIAASALFGGLPAVLVASGAALVCRVAMGGAVLMGVVNILLAALAGLAAHALRRGRPVEAGHVGLLAAGDVLRMGVVMAMAIPTNSRAELLPGLAGITLFTIGATLFICVVLASDERRRELARTNRLYRSMVDALPDCLNIKDAEGRFLAANPATARLMRARSAEALIGRTDFDFYPEGLATGFLRDEQAVLAGGVHRAIEQRGLMGDGTEGWLATLKSPVYDGSGGLVGLITHNRDITAAKALGRELERTQAYLDQALENMNDGLAMFLRDGTLLFCNRRYRELFAVTGHLRVPGAAFADILRASVALGEVVLPPGQSVEAYVADRMEGLRETAERTIETRDGRSLAGRTTVLADGTSLIMVSDVTEQRDFERNLRRQALHDPLTGLPNRAGFNEAFARMLADARGSGGELMVALLDLDHFKQVNDTHGHAAGDTLLREVSRRLEAVAGAQDHVARLGGDEFALLLPRRPGFNDAALAARIMRSLSRPLDLGETTMTPSATVGYTLVGRDGSDADGLLKNADRALYQAKMRRRGTWKLWAPPEAGAASAVMSG